MVASLLKIISTGMQDERLQPLKDQPSLGAFLTVLMKAGRYATNWARIDFDTMPDFGKSGIIRLPSQGEMIGRIFLFTKMPDIKTVQQKVYYTRKPSRAYSNNYTTVGLFQDTKYLETYSFVYPVSNTYANFAGLQLDDLIVGGTYTLDFSVPIGSSALFSLLLTDVPLNQADFNLLNTDTFLIAGLEMSTADQPLFVYSYDAVNWLPITAPNTIRSANTNDIIYTGSQYFAGGQYTPSPGSIMVENGPIGLQPAIGGIANAIAYNEQIWVAVGAWSNPTIGQISWSLDGLNWSEPIALDTVPSSVGNAIYWNSSTSTWYALGQWGSGLFATSTDGKIWSIPVYPQSTNLSQTVADAYQILNDYSTVNYQFYTWGGGLVNDGISVNYIQTIIPNDIYNTLSPQISTISQQIQICTASGGSSDYILWSQTYSNINSVSTLQIQAYLSNLTGYAATAVNNAIPITPSLTILRVDYIKFINDIDVLVASLPPSSILTNIVSIQPYLSNDLYSINQILVYINEALIGEQLLQTNIGTVVIDLNTLNTNINLLSYAVGIIVQQPNNGSIFYNPLDPILVQNVINAMSAVNTDIIKLQTDFSILQNNYLYNTQYSESNAYSNYQSLNNTLPSNIQGILNQLQYNITGGYANGIYINGLKVIITGQFTGINGYLGTILTSIDGGISWYPSTDPGNILHQSISYGTAVLWTGSVWVVTGSWTKDTMNYTSICLSSDGINWSAGVNPTNTITGDRVTVYDNTKVYKIGDLVYFTDNNTYVMVEAAGSPGYAPLRPGDLLWQQVFGSIPPYDAIAYSVAINKTNTISVYDNTKVYKIDDLVYFTDNNIYVMVEAAGSPGYAPLRPGDQLWQQFFGIKTDMIITGKWYMANEEQVSISLASGSLLGYTWGTLLRPTDLVTNSVEVNGITYDGVSTYVAVGNWRDVGGVTLGSILVSNDGETWGTPINPVPVVTTYANAKSIATNGSKWLATGQWSLGVNNYSLVSSDDNTAIGWSSSPFNPTIGIQGIGENIIYDTAAGIFLCVGSWSTGQITVSPDGANWTTPQALSGITSGTIRNIIKTTTLGTANSYACAGNFSSSGIYTTLATIIIDSGIITNTTPINPNLLVAVDSTNSNNVANGIAWNGIEGNGSIYVMVGLWYMNGGGTNSMAYSTNLSTNWTGPFQPQGISSFDYIAYATSVSWNGTQFVAVGNWNGLNTATSTDGINWTFPVTAEGSASGTGTDIIWSGNKWFATGNWLNSNGISIGNIVSFTYGINFFTPINPVDSKIGISKGIIWDSTASEWVAVGQWQDINDNNGQVSRSSDGIVWSTPVVYNYSSIILAGLAIGDEKTIFVGAWSYNTSPIIESSSGLSWQSSSINAIGVTNALAYGNNLVAVGLFSETIWDSYLSGEIVISSDGINWSAPFSPQGYISSLIGGANGICWNGYLYVLSGAYNSIANPQIHYSIFTSSDTINWQPQAIQGIPVSLQTAAHSIAWNGSKFVAVGEWQNINGAYYTITTSINGINWSQPVNPTIAVASGMGSSVVWNGYFWTAIGQWRTSGGTLYTLSTSSDGIIWSVPINITGQTSAGIQSITWNGSLFTYTDSMHGIYTSSDAIDWARSSSLYLPRSIGSRRILPYSVAQPFTPIIKPTQSTMLPENAGSILKWANNTTYGNGTNYYMFLSNTSPTFTFTATNRMQWLTYGTYYNSQVPVTVTLSKVSPVDPIFVTDLVGPHFSWTNSLGHSLVDTASISIGGNVIDTISGQLMEVLDEFQTPIEKVSEASRQLCRAENGFNQETFGYSNTTSQTVITHLPFWFSRGDPGCALPIDALNVDEVRLTVNFKPITSLYYTESRASKPALNVEGGSLLTMLNSPFYYSDSTGSIMANIEPIKAPNSRLLPFPNLSMPNNLSIQESYLMVEYIYLDKPEANRFRIADIQIPIVQHYIFDPVDTQHNTHARIPLVIPNPTRDIFFFCQRYEARGLNAHFLGSRDLSDSSNLNALWWPDASGLDAQFYTIPKPGFSTRFSEPIRWLALNYAETLNRYSTENVALFRTLLPSLEQRKAPWINRYYYNLPLASQNGFTPFSAPIGQANLDKVLRLNLSLGFHGKTGLITDDNADRYWVRTFAETYNILRIYGGRGTMMFAY